LLQSAQGFTDQAAGAADVHPLKTAARSPEAGTLAESDAGLSHKKPVQLLKGDPQLTAVQPEDKGAFRLSDLDLGSDAAQFLNYKTGVFLKVDQERVEPLSPLAVGRFAGGHPENAHSANGQAFQEGADPLAVLPIWDDPVGDIEPGDVEGLARSIEGHGVLGDLR